MHHLAHGVPCMCSCTPRHTQRTPKTYTAPPVARGSCRRRLHQSAPIPKNQTKNNWSKPNIVFPPTRASEIKTPMYQQSKQRQPAFGSRGLFRPYPRSSWQKQHHSLGFVFIQLWGVCSHSTCISASTSTRGLFTCYQNPGPIFDWRANTG